MATYTVTRSDPICLIDASPVAPALTAAECTGPGSSSAPTVTAATTNGITYVISADRATVTATPNTGYQLASLPTGWTLLGGQAVYETNLVSPGACLVSVAPAAPAAIQSVCISGSAPQSLPTITFATTSDVVYSVTAGPYAAGTTQIVTATAATGYQFSTTGIPSGWTLVGPGATSASATYSVAFDAALTCGTATTPSFTNNVCLANGAAGSRFTIPTTDGVDYYLGTTKEAAGTHPVADGTTVTITALAQPGYGLTGITTWSHTFVSAPTCLGVEGVSVHPPTQPASTTQGALPVSSGGLASTGAPVALLVLIGSLLALAGCAMCIGATDRRWFHSA
ncbi:MAG: hypothetical protein ABI368_06480 [Jatrophihabitantaceae bacterium]